MPTAPTMNRRRSTPIGCATGPDGSRDGRGARYQRTPIDTAVPTSVGNSLPSVGSGRVSTAHDPTSPITPVSAYAAARAPRIASTPTPTPMPSSTASAPTTSTTLSLVPKVSIAQSFTGLGTASMNTWPTGTTGDDDPSTRPTTSSATANPAPVASSPSTGPCHLAGAGAVRPSLGPPSPSCEEGEGTSAVSP